MSPSRLEARGPQMGMTEPLPYGIEPVVGMWAAGRANGYLRQVERGNIVYGGGVERIAIDLKRDRFARPDAARLRDQLRALMPLLPALANVSVIRTWSGGGRLRRRRLAGDECVFDRTGAFPCVRLHPPRLPTRPRCRRRHGRTDRHWIDEDLDRRFRHRTFRAGSSVIIPITGYHPHKQSLWSTQRFLLDGREATG